MPKVELHGCAEPYGARDVSPIQVQSNELLEQAEEMAKVVSDLEQRLQIVLRPEGNARVNGVANPGPAPVKSDHLSRLIAVAERHRSTISMLSAIMQRLEV